MANYKDIKYQFPTSAVTSGTFADGRISESSVTAHVSATDLTPVRQDVLTLALKQAVQENHTKYNLPNSSICKFEADADFNLAGSTDVLRNDSEYISAMGTSTAAADAGGTVTSLQDDNTTPSGAAAWHVYGDDTGGQLGTNTTDNHVQYYETTGYLTGNFVLGAGHCSLDNTDANTGSAYFQHGLASTGNTCNGGLYGACGESYVPIYAAYNGIGAEIVLMNGQTELTTLSNVWSNDKRYRWARSGSTLYFQEDDVTVYTVDSGVFSSTANQYVHIGWENTGVATRLSGTPTTNEVYYRSGMSAIKGVSTISVNATGTALGTTNVPSSAVTDVSGVVLLKNAYGSTTLGTDVKAYFTADNSNWTEATSYADAGTFSTGIKMIKLGKATCTEGSDVRWKIVWANQVATSKEAQIYGIGLNY